MRKCLILKAICANLFFSETCTNIYVCYTHYVTLRSWQKYFPIINLENQVRNVKKDITLPRFFISNFGSQICGNFFSVFFLYLPGGLKRLVLSFFDFPAVAALKLSCRVQSEFGPYLASQKTYIR